MPFGTLTLHTQRRDIAVELVDHATATRIIRCHTGRISAAEAYFRGDEVDSDDFDGRTKLISIGLGRVVSVEWDPYPEGDGGLVLADGPIRLTAREVAILRAASLLRGAGSGAPEPADEPEGPPSPDTAEGPKATPAEPAAKRKGTAAPARPTKRSK